MLIALCIIGGIGVALILPFTVYCTIMRLSNGKNQLSTDDLSHLLPGYLNSVLCGSLFFLDSNFQLWVFWAFLYFAMAAYQFRLSYLSQKIFEKDYERCYLCVFVLYILVVILCYSIEVLCVVAY